MAYFFHTGTASLDPKSNGKISMVAILYVVSSNTVGVLVGLIMYFIIKPGTRLIYVVYHHTRYESMYLIIKLGYIICLLSYKVREHVFDHQARLHNMFIIIQGARACI